MTTLSQDLRIDRSDLPRQLDSDFLRLSSQLVYKDQHKPVAVWFNDLERWS